MNNLTGIKDVHADHVASHVGKALGVTTLVRAVPHHAQKRQLYLPTDLMIQVFITVLLLLSLSFYRILS